MSSQKVFYTLTSEAIAIIERRAPSPNKRGQWLSEAVIDYDAITEGVTPTGDAGALEALSARLLQLEKQIAALLRELRNRPVAEAQQ